jgi:hypothetical protein
MRASAAKAALFVMFVLVAAAEPVLAGVPKVVIAEEFGATW